MVDTVERTGARMTQARLDFLGPATFDPHGLTPLMPPADDESEQTLSRLRVFEVLTAGAVTHYVASTLLVGQNLNRPCSLLNRVRAIRCVKAVRRLRTQSSD